LKIELSSELEQVREQVRKFTQRELEPIAAEIDRTGAIPERTTKLLRDNGYLGLRVPEEYGGAGASLSMQCLVLEEFSRSHRLFTSFIEATSGLTPTAFLRHGTPEQREKFLRRLAQGEIRAAFGLTEPGAGSDSSAISTSAKRAEGGWLLTGRKHFISGGHVADLILVIAVTDPQKRARGGITALLVEQGSPGFTVTRVESTIGSEAWKLAELTFEDCFVPDAMVLGEVGQGFKVAMETLTDGRLGVACSCIGAADRLLEMATEHAKTRVTFGKPLAERQAIQWMLADSAVDLATARALVYETLRQVESGKDVGVAPSMCKLYCSEMVGRVSDRAVQIFGGQGVIRGFPVERMYRDVRHYRIGEGSSEVQRMLIARDVLR
jgi:acyl-CoA dehydrogenase